MRPSPGFAETTRGQPPRLATVPPGPAVARRSTTTHPDRFVRSTPIYDHTASEAHRKAGAMNKAQLTSLVADQVSLSKDTARPVVAAVFSTIGEPLARRRQRLVRGLRHLHPQDPRSASCAPRSRSALEPVGALLCGAGRRGLVTARVPTPRPGAGVRPPQRGPGRHAHRSSTVSREPIGSAHRVTLLGQLHAERRRRATRPPAPPLRRSRRDATLE